MKIGRVYANSEKATDRADRNLISMGVIAGDGLLGEVVAAAHDLEAAANDCGYYHATVVRHMEAEDRQEKAWLRLFDALKQIEAAAPLKEVL